MNLKIENLKAKIEHEWLKKIFDISKIQAFTNDIKKLEIELESKKSFQHNFLKTLDYPARYHRSYDQVLKRTKKIKRVFDDGDFLRNLNLLNFCYFLEASAQILLLRALLSLDSNSKRLFEIDNQFNKIKDGSLLSGMLKLGAYLEDINQKIIELIRSERNYGIKDTLEILNFYDDLMFNHADNLKLIQGQLENFKASRHNTIYIKLTDNKPEFYIKP